MDRIYLDYSADTPVDEEVLLTYTETARKFFANPNSTHDPGIQAKSVMDEALKKIAEILKVKTDEIIFTSGASEANNLAIKGIAHAARRKGKHIISTFLEHSSVSGTLTFLQEQGWEIDIVNVLPNGQIDLDHLKSLLRKDTVLCAVCTADSELGAIQPIDEIFETLKDFPNCKLHADATQSIGKSFVDITKAHTVSLAPHKFYGLKGCGILVKQQGVILEPLIHGGASTTLYRSGTPDPAAAAACAKALEIAEEKREERFEQVKELNEFLRNRFCENEKIRINSPQNAIPHILNISVNGIKGEQMRKLLNQRGVCVSVKSACAVANTPSRAVMAVSRDRKNALSSWRICLSHLTTKDEALRFLDILEDIIRESEKI